MSDPAAPSPDLRLELDGIRDGVIEARVASPAGAGSHDPLPQIELVFGDRHLAMATPAGPDGDAGWQRLSVRIPPDVIGDEMRILVLRVFEADTALATIPIAAGNALAADSSAEVAALRAELDLLKRAVRRLGRDADRQ